MADPQTPLPADLHKDRAAALFDSLFNDIGPAGKAVRAKAKEMFDVALPEPDAVVEPLRAEFDERYSKLEADLTKEREERAKERADAQEAQQRQSMEQMLDAARDKYSLTGDGFDKMTARMKETGNYTDAEAAAAWVAQQQPAPQINSKADFLPKTLDFFAPPGDDRENADYALLHSNPQKYMDKSLQDFVNDPDRYVRETLGT